VSFVSTPSDFYSTASRFPSDSTRCMGEGLMRLCADYQQQVKNLVMAAYKEELACA
jgi:hypothetical protein